VTCWRARPIRPPEAPAERDWRGAVATVDSLDETEGLSLLADYGIASLPRVVVDSELAALDAARRIGFPVVLKTAAPGIRHKTDHRGVKLGVADEASVAATYRELASRLGPQVLVTRMAPPGVELAFGLSTDPQFGPVVLVAAGGIWIEVMQDAAHALAPFGLQTARRLIDRLRIRVLMGAGRTVRIDDAPPVRWALPGAGCQLRGRDRADRCQPDRRNTERCPRPDASEMKLR
jgi:hypothetical protein